MEVAVIGVNFKSAPIGLREQLSYSGEQLPEQLRRLRQAHPDTEILLLSTCNRTELYVAADSGLDLDGLTRAFLGTGSALDAGLGGHVYLWRDGAAIEHLMLVSASVDSMVVGETEIQGQVKQAYQSALAAGTLGKGLNSLVQQALRVAKRVRTETDLAKGRVSVGTIAVDLAARVFADLSSKTVLLIGAGKIGEQAVKAVVSRGVRQTHVANRSVDRARALAAQYGGIALPLDGLGDCLPGADIVISSTSTPHCLVGGEAVRAAMAARHGRPMLFIDLAVPRDIDDAVGKVPNVYLYNIDDLRSIAADNLEKRRGAVEQAKAIIRSEAAAVGAELRAESRGVADAMRRLDAVVERIEQSELDRAFAKDKVAPLGDACEHCRHEIRVMLHRALSRLAAGPRKALTSAARDGTLEELTRLAEQFGEPGEGSGGKESGRPHEP